MCRMLIEIKKKYLRCDLCPTAEILDEPIEIIEAVIFGQEVMYCRSWANVKVWIGDTECRSLKHVPPVVNDISGSWFNTTLCPRCEQRKREEYREPCAEN